MYLGDTVDGDYATARTKILTKQVRRSRTSITGARRG